jgi:LysR family pca operon transcriptional activator
VSLPFARGLLERSDMLWFISRGVVARELEDGSLVALDFGGRQMAGAVGLTHRTSRDQHPDIDDLIGLLHKSATKAG